MKSIPLTQGKFALVDDELYDPIMAMGPWNYRKTKGGGYARCRVKRRTIEMHRAVWKLAGRRLPRLLDHKDLNGLNNQLGNLRPATYAQNGQHRGPTCRNRSGFKGVSYYPRYKKWRAQITVRGKPKTLGYFKTRTQAARAYDKAALFYFGEFAYTNFTTAA